MRALGLVALAAGSVLTLSAAAAPAGLSVREDHGNIHIMRGGADTVLTRSGRDRQPVLSPDGSTVAFVREETAPDKLGQGGRSSLWIADTATGAARQLAAPRPADEPKRDFSYVSWPAFSLDGGFIYVMAHAWVTSDAIHQVNLKTGAERFVVDANTLKIVRTGPYRGMLLVSRHKYHHAPQGGSYDPVDLVKPDGKVVMTLPGKQDEDDDGPWLKKHGWQAW